MAGPWLGEPISKQAMRHMLERPYLQKSEETVEPSTGIERVGFQVNMDDWTIGGSMGWTKDAGFLIDLTIGPLHFWARTRRW